MKRPTPPSASWRRRPGPEPTFQPPKWKRFKLKNGLEVFLVEFHDLPLVDLNLMIKTGGAANPPDRAGLADLTAHMLDEGTKSRSALAIADQVAALGATLSTGSTWDASNVSLSTLSRNLDAALAVFSDVIVNPAFDAKEFARVRDNLLTAITRRKDSPPTVANLAMTRAAVRPEASLRLADDGRRGVDQEDHARGSARLLRQVLPAQQRRAAGRRRHDGGRAQGQARSGVRQVASQARPPRRSFRRPPAPPPPRACS